jgi:hypothetical protein
MLVDPLGNRLSDRHKYRINQQIEPGRDVSECFRIRFTAVCLSKRTWPRSAINAQAMKNDPDDPMPYSRAEADIAERAIMVS